MASKGNKTLKAGAAMVDITPKAGVQLAGAAMGQKRPAESIMDHLYAKVVVFKINDYKLCMVGLDVILITKEYTSKIREEVNNIYNIEKEAIMVYATQTHSAPSCGGIMLDEDFPLEITQENEYLTGSERNYSNFVVECTIEAISKAIDNMESVKIGTGKCIADKLAFNRRAVGKNSTVTMPGFYSNATNPTGPKDIYYLEGPTDPQLGILCARTDSMEMKTMLLNFTCHPVNVFTLFLHAVSSDWPGSLTEYIKKTQSKKVVPLVLNGCCGNINPNDPFEPDFIPDHRKMGKKLGDLANISVAKMKFNDVKNLSRRTSKIVLPYRDIPKERKEVVNKILKDNPKPVWEGSSKNKSINPKWFSAASTKSIEYCKKREPKFFYEIQVFIIGQTAIVALPGEPFVEGQLSIKVKSPFKNTFVVHAATQYVGYLPTKKAAEKGGHEALFSYPYWAKFAPDSLDKIVNESLRLLNDLYEEINK